MPGDMVNHGHRLDPLSEAEKIEGWMDKEELYWLMGLSSGSTVGVEIGCYCGRSTKAMAGSIRELLVCVDPWNMKGISDAEEKFRKNLWNEIETKRVHVIRGESQSVKSQVLEALGGRPADFIFLDGDHSYDGVIRDIDTYLDVVAPGGVLCGHDFYARSWPEVTRAVLERFPKNYRLGPKNIWYVQV